MSSRPGKKLVQMLSVVIPARNEEGSVCPTVEHLHDVLVSNGIRHEIIVVDDGSTDRTWELLQERSRMMTELRPVRHAGPHGFGRAVVFGFDHMAGDAVIIMMADESEDCRDVVRYWRELAKGHDCVFGSRFIKGGRVVDYPLLKLVLNRVANTFIRILFGIRLNDTTNAFKAYRREVIEACRPFLSAQFDLTVELPLKAIVRGFSWTMVPATWRNRTSGTAKFRIKEMGSHYLFVCFHIWIEKYLRKRKSAESSPL